MWEHFCLFTQPTWILSKTGFFKLVLQFFILLYPIFLECTKGSYIFSFSVNRFVDCWANSANNLVWGPALTWKKFNAFFVKQSFFYSHLFKFCSLGYPVVRGSDWHGQTCVNNLPWGGGDSSGRSCLKEGHR